MSYTERECRKIIDWKLVKADEELSHYLNLWEGEICERHQKENPTRYSFYTILVVRGRWAADLLTIMSPSDFPLSRKVLASWLVDSWFGCKEIENELFFANIIREWYGPEITMMANMVRRIISFRSDDRGPDAEKAQRIARYLQLCRKKDILVLDDTLYRTMFKALGNHASTKDMTRAAETILQRDKT